MLGRWSADRSEALAPSVAEVAAPRVAWRWTWLVLALASLAALLGSVLLAQVALFTSYAPSSLATSLDDVEEPLRPDAAITVSASGFGTALESARLFRQEVGTDGAPVGREQTLSVRLARQSETTWQVVAADGGTLLRPDGVYRLEVRATAPSPSLPLPRQVSLDRQVRFQTVGAPRVALPVEGTARPRWGEPVLLPWSMPMQSVAVMAQPPVPLKTWVDPADRSRVWVQVGGEGGSALPAGGGTFDLTLMQARSVDGLEIQRPASFKVATPVRPRIPGAPAAPVTLAYGQSFELTTTAPLSDLQVQTSGSLPVDVRTEGTTIRLSLPRFAQGQTAEVALLGGTSPEGAPLLEPVRVTLRTPPALAPPKLTPADEATDVQPTARPRVVFPEPVVDRAAAERSLLLEPAVDGRWEWKAADLVEFVPAERLADRTDFTLTVRGGPDGVRNAAGGYLEQSVATTFRTGSFKRIEVSISRQRMMLWEGDRIAETIVVGTGVPGADTPLGTFQVEYKMPTARFRGTNPSGLTYDIPDVKWILAFYGDYTIHGAYWRTQFGVPGSNGCVGMPDADAKRVYDWAEIGTPITIRM